MMMGLIGRWVRARMTLGVALARHLALLPLRRRRSNPVRWLTRMAGESLGRTPAPNWGHAARSGRCIGCGLCDMFGDAALPRPSATIVGAGRSPGDAPLLPAAARARLLQLADDVRRVCPTGVDTRDVVALIDNNAAVLRAPGAGLEGDRTPARA